MKIQDVMESLPRLERERMLGRLEGMTMAMRICRNRAADCVEVRGSSDRPQAHWTLRADEAHNLAAIIRMMQVQIGSARQSFGALSAEEFEELWRIY